MKALLTIICLKVSVIDIKYFKKQKLQITTGAREGLKKKIIFFDRGDKTPVSNRQKSTNTIYKIDVHLCLHKYPLVKCERPHYYFWLSLPKFR